jgi:arsenite methyltransferase
MTNQLHAARRGHYGIDAPALIIIPVALFGASMAQAAASGTPWPLIGAALILICLGIGIHSGTRGKFAVWDELLASLRGDEQLLDVGCGRGAVLITAARHLPYGRATGVDIWRGRDQSGNSAAATRRNAVLEGVADRVGVETGDMTALPFPDAGFDVVVSMSALHNAGRDRVGQAVDEAVRMLRPGGRLMIADIRFTRRYADRLRALGLRDVTRRNLGPRVWWSGPWLPSVLVSAIK